MENIDKTEEKEIEKILKDEKVQKALELSSGDNKREESGEANQRSSALGITGIIFLVSAVAYFLLEWKYFPVPSSYVPLAQKFIVALMFAAFILVINRILKKILRRKIEDKASVYNLESLINLFTIIIIFIIALSLLFANWYATMVSFGVVSLILGLALQNPITSFFGWLYLLIRKPYEVGDRIKIGTVYGDVINVSYLDTTLWEFRGDYLSGDHPSGRIIKFSNSKIFSEYIHNYSWPLFPFIWNELQFYISYDSDLKFTSSTIQQVAEREVGEAMVRRVKRFKKILEKTLVNELEVRERPAVILKAHQNAWIEVTVRYLVEPKNSGRVKSELFKLIMEELKKSPEKVVFPNTKRR